MSAAADRHRRAAQIELQAAANLGCGASRHCLGILARTAVAGRKPIDDSELIAQVMRLRQAGHGKHSVGIAARAVATGKSVAAVELRLRRKLKFTVLPLD